MKKYMISAAAVLLSGTAYAADPMMAAPMAAHNSCMGNVEAYLGGLHLSGDGDSETYFVYGGTGRANCTFNERWNVQGDLFVDSFDADGDQVTGYGGTAHLYWRDPASYAFGIFGTIAATDASFFGGTRYSFGPEFQIYMNNVTLYGQGEYGQASFDGIPVDIDFWGIRGEVRYFATDNMRFDAELAYRTYDFDLADIFSAAVQANYRFDNTPYTVFARYQYEDLDGGLGTGGDVHKLTMGLRVSFGSGTLLEEDRYGATMSTYRSNISLF
ncbi:hypothetical protein DFR52_102497 [Hoeflea marina]|uniref:Uncharacterized protein n=1 Tax=Hoeflea marina TaxID=274592 RepID=A0A317PMT1_9HYPH|nr:hypothetical protein [Hoeflea marina]PWW01833.1 hypothetical protein DFR52_102497 [Hoeflea marina]